MKKRTVLVFIMTAGLLAGCHVIDSASPELPTPENLYLDDNVIDMFVYQGAAYVNAEDTDWASEQEFTKGTRAGEIKNSGVEEEFQDWDATILPAGTEIYESDDPQILLADHGEELVPYMKYVEG